MSSWGAKIEVPNSPFWHQKTSFLVGLKNETIEKTLIFIAYSPHGFAKALL